MGRFTGGRGGAVFLGAAMAVTALTGCGSEAAEQPQDIPVHAKIAARLADEAKHRAALVTARRVKANELGRIPVLRYRGVTERPVSPYDRTPRQFRAEMRRLAAEGYVPITAAEYVTGRIGVPAGKHPVVLTFDGALPSQFALDEADRPRPDTAVRILFDVARRYPGFRPVATFYVTRGLFGAADRAAQVRLLEWLQDHGFDVGNLTADHRDLRGLSRRAVYDAISAGHRLVTSRGARAPVTLALPYGNPPRVRQWALRGNGSGGPYAYRGVFLAGGGPAPSPFAKDFDPLGIPRIRPQDASARCARSCAAAWLDWLKAHPAERYTSDGDVRTVAYPRASAPALSGRFAGQALPY